MAQIAGLWWLWLLIMVAAGGYAIFNQIRRMKGMLGGAKTGDVDQAFGAFGKGLAGLVISGFVAMIAGILLVIAVLFAITH